MNRHGRQAIGRTRRTTRGERGQATVELVLLLPVIVIGMLAVIQVGLITRDRLVLAHVAREAARAAAVEPTADIATTAARQASGLDPQRLRIGLGPDRATGDRLTIAVSYHDPTDVPLVGLLLGDVTLQADVTVRVE